MCLLWSEEANTMNLCHYVGHVMLVMISFMAFRPTVKKGHTDYYNGDILITDCL